MKIKDLLREAPTPITPGMPTTAKANQLVKKAGGKQLGKGHFGTAYEVPNDVTSVVKVANLDKNNWQSDGYASYIDAIKDIENETQNPYLPQIYEIRHMQPKDLNKPPYLMINIEKLVETPTLTNEELIVVIEKLIGNPINETQRKCIYNEGAIRTLTLIINGVSIGEREISVGLEADFRIIDRQFLLAMDIIRRLNKKGYTVDLHDQNFMFRRTPYGPQLVITDPLSFGNEQGNIRISSAPW